MRCNKVGKCVVADLSLSSRDVELWHKQRKTKGDIGLELFRTKKVYDSICRPSYNCMAGDSELIPNLRRP